MAETNDSHINYKELIVDNFDQLYEGCYIEIPIDITDHSSNEGEDFEDEDGDMVTIFRKKVYPANKTYRVTEIRKVDGIITLKPDYHGSRFETEAQNANGGIILPRYRVPNMYDEKYSVLTRDSNSGYGADEIGDVYMYYLACKDLEQSLNGTKPEYQIYTYREKAAAQLWVVIEHLSKIYQVKQVPGQKFEVSIPVPFNPYEHIDSTPLITAYRDMMLHVIKKLIPEKAMISFNLLGYRTFPNEWIDEAIKIDLTLTIDFVLKQDYDVVGIDHFFWYATGGLYGY